MKYVFEIDDDTETILLTSTDVERGLVINTRADPGIEGTVDDAELVIARATLLKLGRQWVQLAKM